MDRLTNVIQDGPISVLTLKRAESGNVTVWWQWSQCQDPDIEAALHRLADYEDSGLTQERAQEIGKADAEGRVVVLPASLGTPIYKVIDFVCKSKLGKETHYIYIQRMRLNKRNVFEIVHCFGKTAFLTPQEAEAALAKMKEKNNEQSCL